MADFYLVGGDARQRHLARLLRLRGHRVRTFGVASEPQDFPGSRDPIVCLPIPSFRNGKVPGEFHTGLAAEQALDAMKGRHCVIYCSPKEEEMILEAGPRSLLNLARDEAFLRQNAELTAEGAICHLSGNGGRALYESRCLILGYGRIGAALCARLLPMQTQVCVAARSAQARQAAQAMGASVCDFSTLPEGADFLFNTVPERLPEDAILKAAAGALYLELASAPYALDPSCAEEEGLRYEALSGIPGKMYPRSAAECILRAIFCGLPAQILL